jgi:phospholipase/carboxylesterase
MTTLSKVDFIHRFEPSTADGRPALLMLHGTGGDEGDLLPLGRELSPGSALLSPRGRVLENGMPRFFRRHAEGRFDEADLELRAHELADFVDWARNAYGLPAPLAVGFSNGANIASAALMLRPGSFAGAVLLRGMVPFSQPPVTELEGKSVLLLSGSGDPLVTRANAETLAGQLRERGADLRHDVVAGGHGLTQRDVDLAKAWIDMH